MGCPFGHVALHLKAYWEGQTMKSDGRDDDCRLAGLGVILGTFRIGDSECLIAPVEPGAMADSRLREVCRFADRGRDYVVLERAHKAAAEVLAVLTSRELQVAALVAQGCPNKQIADRLRISEWTVATYMRRIFDKLGVDSRAAMTYRCAALIGDYPAPSRPV
jgi:DNA-binding CsgD family transcriptional regulator